MQAEPLRHPSGVSGSSCTALWPSSSTSTSSRVYNLGSRGALTRHAPSHARLAYDLDEIEIRSLARLKYDRTGHSY